MIKRINVLPSSLVLQAEQSQIEQSQIVKCYCKITIILINHKIIMLIPTQEIQTSKHQEQSSEPFLKHHTINITDAQYLLKLQLSAIHALLFSRR